MVTIVMLFELLCIFLWKRPNLNVFSVWVLVRCVSPTPPQEGVSLEMSASCGKLRQAYVPQTEDSLLN